MMNVRQSTKL